MALACDTPAPGIVVCQPRRGFRYGAEAFWLAGFALEPGVPGAAVDLGTGSGIVAFLLAGRGVDVVGYDRREEWSPLWERSLGASSTAGQVRLEIRDITGGVPGRVELVVANPPFFPVGSGPTSPDPWKASARTESSARLGDFVRTGLAALVPGGRLCLVIPVERGPQAELAAPEGHLRRRVRVGGRRVLLEWSAVSTDLVEDLHLAEGDPRVRGWYRAVGA